MKNKVSTEVECNIKPCPFCGSKNISLRNLAPCNDLWSVECKSCGSNNAGYKGINAAIMAWNKRHRTNIINNISCKIEDNELGKYIYSLQDRTRGQRWKNK